MRRLFVGLLILGILGFHGLALAECAVETIFIGSRMIICTVCCTGAVCTRACN